jgi:hypothetical protein
MPGGQTLPSGWTIRFMANKPDAQRAHCPQAGCPEGTLPAGWTHQRTLPAGSRNLKAYIPPYIIAMADLYVKIPKDAEFLAKASDIDLSLLVERMLKEKMERIREIEKGLENSKMTQEKADRIADRINRDLAKRYIE